MIEPIGTINVIRDIDDADLPEASVMTCGDLVLLRLRENAGPIDAILVHPVAARRIAAALVIEAMRAEAVAAAAEGKEGGA